MASERKRFPNRSAARVGAVRAGRGRPRKPGETEARAAFLSGRSTGVRAVEAAAANWLGSSLRDVREATRLSARTAQARQIGMYLARRLFRLSMTSVGHAYGRDRTTVRHACERVAKVRRHPASAVGLDHLEAALALWSARFASRIAEESQQSRTRQP